MQIKEKDKQLLETVLSITRLQNKENSLSTSRRVACPSSVCVSRYGNDKARELACKVFMEYTVKHKAKDLRDYVVTMSNMTYGFFNSIHLFINSKDYLDYIFEDQKVSEEFKSLNLDIELTYLLFSKVLSSKTLCKQEKQALYKDLVYYTGNYRAMDKVDSYGSSFFLSEIIIKQNIEKTIEFLTQKYKKEDLLMKSETFDYLKKCLVYTASGTSEWQLESDRYNSSGSRELCLYVLKNFDYLTESISDQDLRAKNCENLLDLARALCIEVTSERFKKIKEAKASIGTQSIISSWSHLTEANLNYLRSIPLVATDLNEPFNWNNFMEQTKDRISSGRVWYWNGMTDAICVLSQIDFKEYEKYMKELLQASNKHNVRAIKAYADCYNGVCDSKQARKYRSEAQNVSLHAVKGMLGSKDKYDDLTLRKNISQFADSKHQEVVDFLIKTVPPSYLSLFLANPLASKNTIQSRMKVGE
jgi:hypothetical protein